LKESNVLIVGSGGREHAIAWKVSQSAITKKIFVAPGNGGTHDFNVDISATDIESICAFAKKNDCLTIVGPEAPLDLGLVDYLRKNDLRVFGPTAEEARLETSKVFSKNFMSQHNIPTADFRVFSDPGDAVDYAHEKEGKIVVKADGLASGKGVSVCESISQSERAIREIMVDKMFGRSGDKVVLEEKLEGMEASLIALCDGVGAIPFGTAVDHKRLFNGGLGPNTGGMGAFSPSKILTDKLLIEVMDTIVRPVVARSGFRGFLYTGLMLCEDGPKVLEFNARLGDPEAQVILPLLQSDLFEILDILASGGGVEAVQRIKWSESRSCGVVMCSEGYPHNPKIGEEITGLENIAKDEAIVFHSGTKFEKGKMFTNGGRVLCVTALAESLDEASSKAYSAVKKISWPGEFHRGDIGLNPLLAA
jgi:phosphoribosylamine--glycine ligase